MLILAQPTPEPFNNPEPTGGKRIRTAQRNGWQTPSFVPGLDPARLNAAYGPDTFGMPRQYEMTLRVPLGCSVQALDVETRRKIVVWVQHMGKQGLDICNDKKLTFYPGVYPAVDPVSQLVLLGEREFVVRGWFRSVRPKPITIELPAHLTAGVRAMGALGEPPDR